MQLRLQVILFKKKCLVRSLCTQVEIFSNPCENLVKRDLFEILSNNFKIITHIIKYLCKDDEKIFFLPLKGTSP